MKKARGREVPLCLSSSDSSSQRHTWYHGQVCKKGRGKSPLCLFSLVVGYGGARIAQESFPKRFAESSRLHHPSVVGHHGTRPFKDHLDEPVFTLRDGYDHQRVRWGGPGAPPRPPSFLANFMCVPHSMEGIKRPVSGLTWYAMLLLGFWLYTTLTHATRTARHPKDTYKYVKHQANLSIGQHTFSSVPQLKILVWGAGGYQ